MTILGYLNWSVVPMWGDMRNFIISSCERIFPLGQRISAALALDAPWLDDFVALLDRLIWSMAVALAALTAASFAGWFSASSSLGRVLAVELFAWFGISACFAFIFYYMASVWSCRPRRFGLLVLAMYIVCFLWMSWGTFLTALRAHSLIVSVSSVQFRGDLRSDDLFGIVRKMADSLGAPFSFINIFREADLMSPDRSLLDHSKGRSSCQVPGLTRYVPVNGKEISGRAVAVGGTRVFVFPGDDGLYHDISLYGIHVESDADSQRRAASSLSNIVSGSLESRREKDVRCILPDFTNGKWICSVKGDDGAADDVAISLLNQGRAVIDDKALHHAPVERNYIEAQARGQIFGCGVWKQ